jgi:hypothetical protein
MEERAGKPDAISNELAAVRAYPPSAGLLRVVAIRRAEMSNQAAQIAWMFGVGSHDETPSRK